MVVLAEVVPVVPLLQVFLVVRQCCRYVPTGVREGDLSVYTVQTCWYWEIRYEGLLCVQVRIAVEGHRRDSTIDPPVHPTTDTIDVQDQGKLVQPC